MTEISRIGRAESLFHNVEAEQQLLGALLLIPENLQKLGAFARTDLFADPVHQRILSEIQRRVRDGLLVSPVALKGWAEADEAFSELGGPAYLARLAGNSVASNEVVQYARLLDECRAKRVLSEAIARASLDMNDQTAAEAGSRLEASLATLEASSAAGPVSMMAAVTMALDQAFAAYRGEDVPGVATGIPALDHILGKMSPGQLILIGGRPSMGKSAVALSMALNVAREGNGVAVATLEMTPESMAQRALSEATADLGLGLPYSEMNAGTATEAQMQTLKAVAARVAELPIQFLPTTYSDVGALYAGARRAKSMMGDNLKLFVVDYLQLLRADGRSRFEQITQISISLKSMAMQLGIPVVALSQLSRALENREEKRPNLSDLRESGQLEQDADAVLFCYRDEYYLERETPEEGALYEHSRACERAKNRLEIIVAKQRQGAIGTAHVKFNPALNTIWEAM